LEILTPEELGEGNPDIVIENGKIHIVSVGRDTMAVWYRYWEPGTDVDDHSENLPANYNLSAYPNPFNASTSISYTLAEQSEVVLDVYDILGRRVSSLYDGVQGAGSHSLIWDADGFSSGVYFYRLTAGEFEESQKMMLVK
jgi:hypothetical protein